MENIPHDQHSLDPPDLATVAAEIVVEHAAVTDAVHSALEHARRAGQLLIAARDQLNHGAWLPWLATHCPNLPERTAQAYMRIARRWTELESNTPRVADLPVRQALALLAEPREREMLPIGNETDSPLDVMPPTDDDPDFEERATRELRFLAAALEHAEVEGCGTVIHRIQEIESEAFARRTHALRKLGQCLNWAEQNGWGPTFHHLLAHPDSYDAFRAACDARIAELQTT